MGAAFLAVIGHTQGPFDLRAIRAKNTPVGRTAIEAIRPGRRIWKQGAESAKFVDPSISSRVVADHLVIIKVVGQKAGQCDGVAGGEARIESGLGKKS